MKVLLYGDTDTHASGAWCYAQALRKLGHSVATFDDCSLLLPYQRYFLLKAYRHFTARILSYHRRQLVGALLEKIREVGPDIIIIIKGLHIGFDDVQRLKASGAWVVVINHDDYFSHNRHNRNSVQQKAVAAYDHIFVTRHVNVGELSAVNSNISFIPFAYDPTVHKPTEWKNESEREQWVSDVLFVGTWEPDRCRLLEHLVQAIRANFAIYGTHWHHAGNSSPALPFWRRRALNSEEMAKAIGGAKLTLGFLRKANRDTHTQRTFEVPACGGVLLAERTSEHIEILRPGIDAEFFDAANPSELVDQVNRLLNNAAHREKLRQNGFQAVTAGNHTYVHRVNMILKHYPVLACVSPTLS